MKELKIHGNRIGDKYSCNATIGSLVSINAWNTITQILRHKLSELASFLDKNGQPFYSKDGIPLQGKK